MNKYLFNDLIASVNKLSALEEQYNLTDENRIIIRDSILKVINELGIELDELNQWYKERSDFWRYHAIGDRKCIILEDKEVFLRVLLALANKINNRYDISRIPVIEVITAEDGKKLAHTRWVDILTDRNSLAAIKSMGKLSQQDLIEQLNYLSVKRRSFVVVSGLINEYNIKSIRERIASSDGRDVMISVIKNETLDKCIDKLVTYMTKNGSDFTNVDVNNMAYNISSNGGITRKRTLSERNYVRY